MAITFPHVYRGGPCDGREIQPDAATNEWYHRPGDVLVSSEWGTGPYGEPVRVPCWYVVAADYSADYTATEPPVAPDERPVTHSRYRRDFGADEVGF